MILSVIIPAFNEEKTLRTIVARVRAAAAPGIEKEIVIVDDHSRDGTGRVAEECAAAWPEVRALRQQDGRKGKGAAIRTALDACRGDAILVQDADLEYDPDDYAALLAPMRDGGAKVVYGSRRLLASNRRHSGWTFFAGGLFLTWLANLLYGIRITDEPTCYKVLDAATMRSLELECERFEFCPEVTAKVARRGIPIVEVPIRYYPRSVREGKKIRWRDGWEAIRTLFRYRSWKPRE